jgi:hypothetical protein
MVRRTGPEDFNGLYSTYMWVERIRAVQENVGRKSVG